MSATSIFSTSAPINIALLEVSRGIGDVFVSIAESCGIVPHTRIASYDEMPEIARRLEPGLDVIMCRSGTAEHVAKEVSIPVIAIPITSFDVISTLRRSAVAGRRVAVFTMTKAFSGLETFGAPFGCEIHQYVFAETDEIPDLLERARAAGDDFCVGGALTHAAAAAAGLGAALVVPNEDSVLRSVQEALKVVQVRRADRSRAAWFEVVLDAINQGIVVTDTSGRVVVYNDPAKRICRITADGTIGENMREIVEGPEVAAHLGHDEREAATLKTIHGQTFALRRFPVLLDEESIGTVATLEDVTRIQHLEEQIRTQLNKKGLRSKYVFADILGDSAEIRRCRDLAQRYASTAASVLIEGETGTGKELFAQSIHNASARAVGPFVAVNCAAVPESLLESEFFGYEGGAFTNARKEGKSGLFEQAHKGTIFLDEIGEIPTSLQARLLRVLQEREVRRVGGDKVIPVDVRIVAATNQRLLDKVRDGLFREDLFYRLNVLNLHVPPIRERKADIRVISASILRGLSIEVSDAMLDAILPTLVRHDWPGNIRELHNVLERFSLMASAAIGPADWRRIIREILDFGDAEGVDRIRIAIDTRSGLKEMLREAEHEIVRHFVSEIGNLEVVSSRLRIGRTSLWRKMKDRESGGTTG
jgi:transcriptional regulator with PAS, ATPase and Fis domain